MEPDHLLQCFKYFYHMDKANACVHCSDVRFSPITFRLCEALQQVMYDGESMTIEMAEVVSHFGQYVEDKGR